MCSGIEHYRGCLSGLIDGVAVQVVYSDESGLGSELKEPLTVVAAFVLNMDRDWVSGVSIPTKSPCGKRAIARFRTPGAARRCWERGAGLRRGRGGLEVGACIGECGGDRRRARCGDCRAGGADTGSIDGDSAGAGLVEDGFIRSSGGTWRRSQICGSK